jgi:tRNA 2-selenouridine synthase
VELTEVRQAGYAGRVDGFTVSAERLYPRGGGRAAWRIVDVRAPAEFAKGALPGAVNAPILSDAERHEVGLRYQEQGQAAASQLGYRLVEAELPARVARWQRLAAEAPSLLACWRGGLRSELACAFAARPDLPRLQGGYRAARQHLTKTAAEMLKNLPVLVVAGLTGSGKTRLIRSLRDSSPPRSLALDLEGQARHRGSAFGGLPEGQPSQASFENALAAELVLADPGRLILEDESRFIGLRQLPAELYARVAASPVVLLEESLASRSWAIFDEYVAQAAEREGVAQARAGLEASLRRLHKRLGGASLSWMLASLGAAEREGAWNVFEAHRPWLSEILKRYYDPLYLRALEGLDRPVAFRGGREECEAWLTRQASD